MFSFTVRGQPICDFNWPAAVTESAADEAPMAPPGEGEDNCGLAGQHRGFEVPSDVWRGASLPQLLGARQPRCGR